jgi:hypothetical protein
MRGWDSTRMIGDVDRYYKNFKENHRDYNGRISREWLAFYNGWLEGRLDMLGQMEVDQESFGSIKGKEPFRREE